MLHATCGLSNSGDTDAPKGLKIHVFICRSETPAHLAFTICTICNCPRIPAQCDSISHFLHFICQYILHDMIVLQDCGPIQQIHILESNKLR